MANHAFAVDSLERVIIDSVVLVNGLGAKIGDNINVRQSALVQSNLGNFSGETQDYVYLVQIKDESSNIISLTFVIGQLLDGQTMKPASSLGDDVINNAGTYTAEVYVWRSIDNADALSDPKKITFIVS